MRITTFLVILLMILVPAVSDARCRTVGESASLGSEYGTFPMYPAVHMVHAGQARESVLLQWAGYGLGVPLFFVSVPFGMAGAVPLRLSSLVGGLRVGSTCGENEARDRIENLLHKKPPPLARLTEQDKI